MKSSTKFIKYFIDTNLLVNYLIFSKIKKRTSKNKLQREYQKIKPSYELIVNILENKNNKNKFITSPLAFSEIFYAIYNEYICRRMYLDGVPFSTWVNIRYKYSTKLTSKDMKELYKDINDLMKEIEKKIKIVNEIYDFKFIQKLVLRYDLRTHDAVLFSTAKHKKCSFFITKDGDFLDNIKLKKYKKLKIISPEEIKSFLYPSNI